MGRFMPLRLCEITETDVGEVVCVDLVINREFNFMFAVPISGQYRLNEYIKDYVRLYTHLIYFNSNPNARQMYISPFKISSYSDPNMGPLFNRVMTPFVSLNKDVFEFQKDMTIGELCGIESPITVHYNSNKIEVDTETTYSEFLLELQKYN
jgi:hypothetical protein